MTERVCDQREDLYAVQREQRFRGASSIPPQFRTRIEQDDLDELARRRASAQLKRHLSQKWDRRFLDLAKLVSSWSKDPSTQTGAVFVAPDKSVISVGYNGFPKGIADHPERYADRDIKLSLIVHCEMNAMMSAGRSVRGSTLYTHPFISCDRCAVHMIQAGVVRVVAPTPTAAQNERWGKAFEVTRSLFAEAGVECVEIEL